MNDRNDKSNKFMVWFMGGLAGFFIILVLACIVMDAHFSSLGVSSDFNNIIIYSLICAALCALTSFYYHRKIKKKEKDIITPQKYNNVSQRPVMTLSDYNNYNNVRIFSTNKELSYQLSTTPDIQLKGVPTLKVISADKIKHGSLHYNPEKLHYGSVTVGGVTTGGIYKTGGDYSSGAIKYKDTGKAVLDCIDNYSGQSLFHIEKIRIDNPEKVPVTVNNL